MKGQCMLCLGCPPPRWASRISSRPGGIRPRPQTWKLSADHMSSPGRTTTLCSLGKLQCCLQREGSSLLGTGKLFVHFPVSVGQERFGRSQGHSLIGAVMRESTVMMLCTLGCSPCFQPEKNWSWYLTLLHPKMRGTWGSTVGNML